MSRSKSIAIRTHEVSYSSRNKAVVVLAEQILIVLKIPLNHLSLKMPCMLCYPGEHSIGDIKPSIGGCWLLISLCMGDNHSFGDSTQRVSVNRNGGKCKGPLKKSCPPPSEVTVPGYNGGHFGGRALCCCCTASEGRPFLCEVACLGPISCLLNFVFKMILI